jgi:hypothetical protein
MRVAFVTPAWRRLELSMVCFAHRRWMLDQLAHRGIDAFQIVITDDRNADLALHHGFTVVEQGNDGLGARFNTGYQVAAAAGADYVVPVGSDTWLHPDLIHDDPADTRVTATREFAVIRRDGTRIALLHLGHPRVGPVNPMSVACWMLPVRLLEPHRYRPCAEQIMAGCDGSTFKALNAEFDYRDAGPVDLVAFRSNIQITSWQKLISTYRGPVHRDPWQLIAARHPQHLVDQARALHQTPEPRPRSEARARFRARYQHA